MPNLPAPHRHRWSACSSSGSLSAGFTCTALETIYVDKESESLHLGAYYQRSVSAAHRRFLSAIKTLVVVRKLALPGLRVNIASKQGKGAGAAQLHEEKRGRPGRRSRRRGGRIGARYPAAGAARRSG